MEVRNRFKGLELIDRVPDELWTEVCDIVQETGIKTIPMEKNCEKAKQQSTLRSKEIRPLVNSFELLDQHLPESTLDSLVTWSFKDPSNTDLN